MKPEDSENLTKNHKDEQQTSLKQGEKQQLKGISIQGSSLVNLKKKLNFKFLSKIEDGLIQDQQHIDRFMC